MAFVLKKKQDFEFQVEGAEKIYTIPAIDTFNADEIQAFQELRGTENITEAIEAFKKTLFSKCEGIEGAALSDYQLMLVLKAYIESQADSLGK